MRKNVTLKKAQKFCKALYFVEFQLEYPLNQFKPLEMGSCGGCITDIVFELHGIEYSWTNTKKGLVMHHQVRV